jgi:hypothetical protein
VSEPPKGALTGKNLTDRAKVGSKHHLLVDKKGQPLAERLTGATIHDTHELFPGCEVDPIVWTTLRRSIFAVEPTMRVC